MDRLTTEDIPKRSRAREIYSSLFSFFGFILLWLVSKLAAVGGGAVFFLAARRGELSDKSFGEIAEALEKLLSDHTGAITLAGNLLFLAAAIIVLAVKRKNNRGFAGPSRGILAPCLAAIPLGASLSFLISAALSLIPWPERMLRGMTDIAEIRGGGVLTFVSVAVAAPLAEELLFRGIGISKLKRTVGAAPAVIVTAVLFAAAHGNPVAACGALAFGLVLGPLFMRGGLLACALCHSAFNLTALLADGRITSPALFAGSAFICAGAAIGLLYLTFKRKG